MGLLMNNRNRNLERTLKEKLPKWKNACNEKEDYRSYCEAQCHLSTH